MNGYNFTDRVRRSLARARVEAGELGHQYVGPEHMLLGMLLEQDGLITGAFKKFHVDPSAVEREILRRVARGEVMSEGQQLPYSARAKRSIELAMIEASRLGHGYVGNGHILLGIIREGKNVAAETLVALGVTFEGTRDEVLRSLGDDVVATGAEWLTELGPMTRQLADSLSDVRNPRTSEELLLIVVSDQCGARHLLEVSGVDIVALQEEIRTGADLGRGVAELVTAAKGEQRFLEDCALASHHLLLAYLALRPAHGYRALSDRGVTHASVRSLAEKIFG